MQRLIFSLILIAFCANIAVAWWEVKYDTTEIRWPNGNLKEYWTSSWFTANEGGFIRNGQYSSWYSSGQLQRQGEYLNGNKHFVWTEWYEDGQLAQQTEYRSGLKHGLSVAWHPNHDIKYIAHYRNDFLHGLYTRRKAPFSPNNPLLSIIDRKFYLNGQVITTYYEDGKFIHGTGPYYCEESGYWIETSKDFGEFAVGHKMDEQKNGRWTTYHADGSIKTVEWYKNGVLIDCGENEK